MLLKNKILAFLLTYKLIKLYMTLVRGVKIWLRFNYRIIFRKLDNWINVKAVLINKSLYLIYSLRYEHNIGIKMLFLEWKSFVKLIWSKNIKISLHTWLRYIL